MPNNPLTDAALAELDRQYGRAESETGTKIDLAVAMNAAYLAYPALRQRLLAAESRLAEAERERDAAEAILAGMRGALELLLKCNALCVAIPWGRAVAALALTPASAGARLKAEACREAAQRILNDPRRWPTVIANHIVHDLCAEADRLTAEAEKEAANGK